MSDDLDEQELNKKLDALFQSPRRRRGRPRTGFTKAEQYSTEVQELRLSGMRAWSAKKEVARRNHKTAEHISQCVKKVADTDPYEYCLEHDRTEDVS